jgi:hypothetical protein
MSYRNILLGFSPEELPPRFDGGMRYKSSDKFIDTFAAVLHDCGVRF